MFKKFEYYHNDYNAFGITVMNPYEDGCGKKKYCKLHIQFFKHSIWYKIPQLFKPREKWVDLTHYDWASIREDGRKGYTDYIRRSYGFSVDKTALHVYYGIQPMTWSANDPENSDHTKVWFFPWNQTRRIRYDFYNLDGTYCCSALDRQNGACDFKAIEKARNTAEKAKIKFKDFDGEEITAECYIEEMEWRYGTGLFKWLRYVRKPIVRRTLDINFDKETGYEKGSWKGGTISHGIELLPNETPLEAFKRYGSAEDKYKHHGTKNRNFTDIVQL